MESGVEVKELCISINSKMLQLTAN